MTWPFGDLRMFGYGMIMIDPAWEHAFWSDKGANQKSARGQYRTTPLQEILALPVGQLASDNAVLWLWARHCNIHQALQAIDAWGFRFSTSGVWVKRTRHGKLAMGTGNRLRCASEPFLIATVGAPQTPRDIRTVIEGPLREHSRKPEEAYAVAEHMTPPGAFRADVFARVRRKGWDGFGDELDKFQSEEDAA